MNHNPNKISQANTGSMSGGMQASIGNNNQQSILIEGVSSNKTPSQAEVMESLTQIEAIIQSSHLPDADKNTILQYLRTARSEAQEEVPDKDFLGKNLERAIRTLKTTDEAVEVGTNLLEKITPVISTIIAYLGVFAATILPLI